MVSDFNASAPIAVICLTVVELEAAETPIAVLFSPLRADCTAPPSSIPATPKGFPTDSFSTAPSIPEE